MVIYGDMIERVSRVRMPSRSTEALVWMTHETLSQMKRDRRPLWFAGRDAGVAPRPHGRHLPRGAKGLGPRVVRAADPCAAAFWRLAQGLGAPAGAEKHAVRLFAARR